MKDFIVELLAQPSVLLLEVAFLIQLIRWWADKSTSVDKFVRKNYRVFVHLIRTAEKLIPNDTTNAGLKRADEVCRLITEQLEVPDGVTEEDIRAAISSIHNQIEKTK